MNKKNWNIFIYSIIIIQEFDFELNKYLISNLKFFIVILRQILNFINKAFADSNEKKFILIFNNKN
jgi:hypothetical protein